MGSSPKNTKRYAEPGDMSKKVNPSCLQQVWQHILVNISLEVFRNSYNMDAEKDNS